MPRSMFQDLRLYLQHDAFPYSGSTSSNDIISEAVKRMLSRTAMLRIEHVETGPKLRYKRNSKASEHQSES